MVGFEPLFEAGRTFDEGTVEVHEAGALALPSGRVAVFDPSGGPGQRAPLARAVAPGTYPVLLGVVRLAMRDERRVAAAMLRLRDAPIARWEPALPQGNDPGKLLRGEFFGYGVDGGVACFADGAGASDVDFDLYEQRILMPMLDAQKASPVWGTVAVPEANLVAFTTGAGDGFYASFWGLDAADQPVALVTEFRIIGKEVTGGARILAAAWPGREPEPPAGLAPLFEVGRTFEGGSVLAVEEAGTLELPTGRIAIFEPVDREDGAEEEEDEEPVVPLARTLPPGSYRARLSIVRMRLGKREIEAPGAVWLEVSGGATAAWEVALPDGLDFATLSQGETTGIGFTMNEDLLCIVDAADLPAARASVAELRAAVGGEEPWRTAVVPVGKGRALVMRMRSAGSQIPLWGLDAAGQPTGVGCVFTRVGSEVVKEVEIRRAHQARS
jgi:hypothetical protein